MTTYDSMSVHELVKKAYQVGHDDWPALALEFKELPLIESALRKAVIREASVGVVKLLHNGVASDYDIVPKETP